MAVVIRAAAAADVPAITAIYAEAVPAPTATFEIDPPDLAEMTRRYDAIVGQGLPYLVAHEDGRVLGYAYAGPHRPRPAYRFTVEDSIYLAPQAQRRGIGLLLLNQLVATCEAQGYRQMVAVIGDSANAGSVALHAKAGFSLIGTHPNVGYKLGRWLDTVQMQRALGAGAATEPDERGSDHR
jgi:L-amino acid N-acyltransferase YncA